MAQIPEVVIKSWETRQVPVVFSTVDKNGIPNSIYASCVWIYNKEIIVIADNYLNKTLQNILDGSSVSVLFITEEKKSFQIKGRIEYHKEGEIFDFMKMVNPTKLPGKGAVALKIQVAYSGSEKL